MAYWRRVGLLYALAYRRSCDRCGALGLFECDTCTSVRCARHLGACKCRGTYK